MQLEYFLMLDRVQSIDLDAVKIHVQSTVPMESTVFEGHFPGMPLVPGVLLIETMAQCAGLLCLGAQDFEAMPLLMSVDKAKIRSFVEPGAKLDVFAHIEHFGSGYFVAKTEIKSDGKRICDAQLKLRTLSFDEIPVADTIREKVTNIGLFTAIETAKKVAQEVN